MNKGQRLQNIIGGTKITSRLYWNITRARENQLNSIRPTRWWDIVEFRHPFILLMEYITRNREWR
jgi:hypothetical protein